MSPKGNHTALNRFNNKSDQCKISDLTKACDCLDNLQISIYQLNKEKFIYSNLALKRILGNHATEIINKSWDFWFKMVSEDEVLSVKNKINNFFSMPYFNAPYVLKYHILNENGKRILIRHELLLHYLEDNVLAINYFFDITEKEKIEDYFKLANNTYKDVYDKKNLISPREEEVLKLVADGFSSKQIADKLFISNHTAITHRKNLIEKFKVKNTAQLIKRVSRNIELW
ncbi:helix-turn-helix transcriptional regulator [Hwangdonia lutea]|uniref:Helix-turn-helix transcriptional regulator n=1 Tax=Hwangdonia lutea TaxID=3075823 RepID=A0AA97EMK4_9FLAO|nr:helix-turn-helix transcriptional regulator [Hwangdonia sp. SCSIO 19198]WOD42850.1 helix-turn-helix transcriptional regulator [Hwangdonia sp. SCSIO 19198]